MGGSIQFRMLPTPLIQISEQIYAKFEAYQPTGSVKDRMVNYIFHLALERGDIIPHKTRIYEATSGNTGISLSSVAARYGCPCTIIMPENMSVQRRQMMKAFGAQIELVGHNAFADALARRNRLLEQEDTWSPKQFENPENVACHMTCTAPEIQRQVLEKGLRWRGFVHGAGTGGTMMGIKRYIDSCHLPVDCVLTVPDEGAHDHGIQGINDGADFLLDRDLMDATIRVPTSKAIQRMKAFARQTGLLVGISSGANLVAAETYVQTFKPKGIIITMLCDRGERYI